MATATKNKLVQWDPTDVKEELLKKYPPKVDVDIKSLADGFMSLFEGAFVLSKSLQEADVTFQQLQHYKTYIRLLFDPKLAA